jgi:hypothetical protein
VSTFSRASGPYRRGGYFGMAEAAHMSVSAVARNTAFILAVDADSLRAVVCRRWPVENEISEVERSKKIVKGREGRCSQCYSKWFAAFGPGDA